jgi:nucleoside permease NupC
MFGGFAGVASIVVRAYAPMGLAVQYIIVGLVFCFGFAAISRGLVIEPPVWMTNSIADITGRLSRRFATAS